MPEQEPGPVGDTDGNESIGNAETEAREAIAASMADSPPAVLFGDHAKTLLLTALADAFPRGLNPTSIVENAGIGSRQSWYEYRDDLLAAGAIEQVGQAGNSPLYALADTPVGRSFKQAYEAGGANLRENGYYGDEPDQEERR
jgi:hypothetical protein